MTASTSLSVFHQWLLADAASQASACAIVLHCGGGAACDRLILEIAEYLNEYDDEGDGRWLAATSELIEKICLDPNHRRLLGMSETIPGSHHDLAAEMLATQHAIAGRGHVVLKAPEQGTAGFDLADTFHAGIGCTPDLPGKCHITLNPDLMERNVIAQIVGDVFLEWIHCEIRRHAPVRDIR